MYAASTGHARFFHRSGPHSLAAVAQAAQGIAASELDMMLEGVAPLQTAGPSQVSFLDNRRYAEARDPTHTAPV
jgi:UDP-3-O-[3-hydroxymyristoyl] glucosamine N-acyltransferase